MPLDPQAILGQSHDLEYEFPEYVELIEDLSQRDQDFARLCKEYRYVNRDIIRIEQHTLPRSHGYCEELKRQRLRCKDQMYRRLRQAEAH